MSNVIANINLAALNHNLQIIKQRAPKSKILAMVKGNGYGHQAPWVAECLQPQVDAFGVACMDEALELKQSGITAPILILMGFLSREELLLADQYKFSVVIHNYQQLKMLEQTPLNHLLNIWLKIDTGMHRLGFAPEEVNEVYRRLMASGKVSLPIEIMTHFAEADNIQSIKTAIQLQCFIHTVQNLNHQYSIANSSALLNYPELVIGYLRPGIILYGVSPLPNSTGLDLGFKPVMTLTSKIIALHDLKAGESVGYGSTWTCPEDMRIGIVAAGYGDGYARDIQNGAPILVNGVMCSVIGRIAMDMTTVDLRPFPNAQIDDPVVLWGEGLPIENVAKYSSSVSYELFCRLTKRVKFVKS